MIRGRLAPEANSDAKAFLDGRDGGTPFSILPLHS